MRYAIPLVVFVVIAVFLASRLRSDVDPHLIPSNLINTTAPAFQLPELHNPSRTFSPQQLRGKVWLLNVWFSSCAACRQEHPLLVALSNSGSVPIYGFDWKDEPEQARAVLEALGDPYVLTVTDTDGRVALDYGVTGAPETYLIDKNGVIRYKEVGQLTPDILKNKILPMVQELNK